MVASSLPPQEKYSDAAFDGNRCGPEEVHGGKKGSSSKKLHNHKV